MRALRDSHDRHFTYLRLSLTEKCNFKCTYCLPNGYKAQSCTPDRALDRASDLSVGEIKTLLSAFRKLGFTKIRLTGGEPTLRQDIVEIVALAKGLGFETVALTTNAYRLLNLLEPLKTAGLDQINISLDSLDPRKFKEISGRDCGEDVILAIHKAAAMNFRKVKVNTVLMKGFNDLEFAAFLAWVQKTKISLRFIELMPTLENKKFFEKHYLSSQTWIENLKAMGWSELKKTPDAGPAIELKHAESLGEIGFITPFQNTFCQTCNRLRISSKGGLRLCLFGAGDKSLRHFLQAENQQENLLQEIEKLILVKRPSHYLNEGDKGETRSFSSIGG